MKHILIDLWGTLLQNPQLNPVEEIISTLKLDVDHSQLIKICDEQGLFSKTINSLIIWESILKLLDRSKEDALVADEIWLKSSKTVRLFPGTKEFLLQLKEKGHQLILASAIDKDSFELLEEHFDFKKYFDYIKTTYVVGLSKSKPYYEKICSDLNLDSKNTYMIGDNISYDILPANEASLSTIFLNRYVLSKQDQNRLPQSTIICDSYEEVIKNITNHRKV